MPAEAPGKELRADTKQPRCASHVWRSPPHLCETDWLTATCSDHLKSEREVASLEAVDGCSAHRPRQEYQRRGCFGRGNNEHCLPLAGGASAAAWKAAAGGLGVRVLRKNMCCSTERLLVYCCHKDDEAQMHSSARTDADYLCLRWDLNVWN